MVASRPDRTRAGSRRPTISGLIHGGDIKHERERCKTLLFGKEYPCVAIASIWLGCHCPTRPRFEGSLGLHLEGGVILTQEVRQEEQVHEDLVGGISLSSLGAHESVSLDPGRLLHMP